MIAYKLFNLRKDGTLGSLFINRRGVYPLHRWLEAEEHYTKGFAKRFGWHCLTKPEAPHLSLGGRVWARVEIRFCTRYLVPPSHGKVWYLARKMKILRTL